MPLTRVHEMNNYLTDTKYAMERIFGIVNEYNTERRELSIKINELQRRINEILLNNDYPVLDDLGPKDFYLQQQGYRSLEYLKNQLLQTKKNLLNKEFSIKTLYGTILQIAKQGISTVYGNDFPISLRDEQSGLDLVNIIIEARNQSMHFEENNPRRKVKECFAALHSSYGDEFDITKVENKSKEVVFKVLKWHDYSDYEKTMQDISTNN